VTTLETNSNVAIIDVVSAELMEIIYNAIDDHTEMSFQLSLHTSHMLLEAQDMYTWRQICNALYKSRVPPFANFGL
jgi:hypothetical protein